MEAVALLEAEISEAAAVARRPMIGPTRHLEVAAVGAEVVEVVHHRAPPVRWNRRS